MLLIGIIVAHLLLLLNLKFTAWPEMLLWPYLITKGWLPYVNIAIAHTPHLIVDLAIIYKIFGTGINQLKICTWTLILFTDFILFFVAKKLSNQKIALMAIISYVFWQIFFDGNGLWFDLMSATLALITFYFTRSKKYFLAGIFWVIMFFTKQTAVWFLIPIGLEVLQSAKYRVKRTKELVFGALIIFIPILLIFGIVRVLPDFYRWAIHFGIFILPKAQGQIQFPNIKNFAISIFPFLIFVPLVWKTKMKNLDLLTWSIAGSLGAYPRFEYFHFQPAISFLAIAIANFFTTANWKNTPIKIFAILYTIISLYLFSGFFMRNFREGTRFYEKDVQDIVLYIQKNKNQNDKIFVINWWDNVYALRDRLPAVK